MLWAFPSFAEDPYLSYEQYLNEGVQAFKNRDDQAALDYFHRAHLLYPSAEEPLQYINLIKRTQDERLQVMGVPLEPDHPEAREKVIQATLDQFVGRAQKPLAITQQPLLEKKVEQPLPARKVTALPALSATQVVSHSSAIRKTNDVLSLDDVVASSQDRPSIRIVFGSSVIVEGRNLQRFLAVNPEALNVKPAGRDQIIIEAKHWGSSFLHIWDERGRTTVYVEVMLPAASNEFVSAQSAAVEHAPPFRMNYALDNSSFYYGPDLGGLRRRSLNVQETFGLTGETPYGLLDTSLVATGFNPVLEIPNYTLGLSHVPMPGTSDLNLRVFDGYRFLSPLTMVGTRLKGAFADVVSLNNILAVSVSHGAQMGSFNYLPGGGSTTKDSFIDAVRVSLFPGNTTHEYSINFAQGSGSERDEYLTKKVYSIEGRQKLGPVDLNAELARDDENTASLAGAQWLNGALRQRLSFREINKDFTTIVSSPSNQGEIGGTWTTSGEWDRLSMDTYVDVYKDRIFPNEQDPEALNLDSNVHTRIPFGEKYAVDAAVRYVHTPGEMSPRRYASVDGRLTRELPVWGGRKGSVYVGGVDQRSRFSFASESEYDREAVSAGVQVPLTRSLSGYLNYEYSWLHEKFSLEDYNPSVMNAGLSYSKQLTNKLSGNLGLMYRDEENVEGRNSFLAGEDSVSASAGLSYNPKTDVNFFCDSRLRNVLAQIPDNPSYNDLDVRFGMRMAFGLGFSLDSEGIVTGFVFKDRDGNKKFDPQDTNVLGDEGLAGIKVKIGDKEAVTDERGWYRLAIRGKKVIVTPVLESLPTGFVFSTPSFAKLELRQGQTSRVDFGLTSQSGVYGVAFVDRNGNGIPDQGDRFVSRVKVLLDGKGAQVTDGRGAYFFKNIAKGKHTLTIDMKDLPAEFIPLVKLKNSVDVVEGTTYVFHIPLKAKAE